MHSVRSFFQRVGGAGEEDRMRPCSSLDEVESLGSVPALPPPLLLQWWADKLQGFEAASIVSNINEWQARLNDF